MKTIKFLSFILLLSLGWIGCEDRTKVRVEAEDRSEAALDDAYTTSKSELERSIDDLRTRIDMKMEELEAELDNADDDRRAEINVRLDEYRTHKSDLERLGDRIANATAEGWAELETEAAQVIADIRDGID